MTRRTFVALSLFAPASPARLELRVFKTGLMAGKHHTFSFSRFRCAIAREATITVESASIVCEDDWVKENDRRKILDYALNEMLMAPKYPQIKWVSTSALPSGRVAATIAGNLTIRDRTNPVQVNVKPLGGGANMWEASATISLGAFGLKRPSAALGAVGTKDEMELSFRGELNNES